MVNLDSSRAKIGRARIHKEALEQEIQVFIKENPPTVVSEVNPQSGEKTWRIQGPITQPPDTLSLVLGDTLFNYRCALDHLVWSIVEACGGTPDHRNQFPICDTANRFLSVKGRYLQGMSSKAEAIIKAEQPCHTGNPTRGQALTFLNDLNNIDKHRYLHLVVASTEGGLFSHALPMNFANMNLIYEGPVDDKTVLARLPRGYDHVEFHPLFRMAFDPAGQDAPGESVIRIMLLLDFIIEDIVNHFARIPLP